MSAIQRILFPVDFSSACEGAARYVEFFAGRFEAEIMLLHAVVDGEEALATEILPARKKQLEGFLAAELKHFTTHRVCVIGEPEKEIARAVRSWFADVIMMSTHGLGYFRRFLLGSVTAKILHDLDTPVWTSVHAEAAPTLEQIHCRRILCALDLSQRSLEVLKWASQLATAADAALAIVHAVVGIDAKSYGQEFLDYLSAEAHGRIRDLQAEAGSSAEVFIDPGIPAKVVACAAEQYQADLVVIGRHGGEGLAGHIFQNAYSILGTSPCPVMSI